MNGRIEWDVAADPLRACLMVEVKERGILSPATLDDLKRACEAVGLVVVDSARPTHEKTAGQAKALGLKVREAARQKYPLDGTDSQSLEGALSMTERERDAARENHNAAQPLVYKLERDVEVAQEQANALRSQLARAEATIRQTNVEMLTADNATLRDQLAEAEAQHAATQDATLAKSAYISKLEAQLTALTPTDGPATDGDLLAMAGDAYRLRSREDATLDDMRKLALAVAARVRRERGECLVERLVESGISWQVAKAGKFQRWISIDGKTPVYVSCADVPVTLARLAGLDGGR